MLGKVSFSSKSRNVSPMTLITVLEGLNTHLIESNGQWRPPGSVREEWT